MLRKSSRVRAQAMPHARIQKEIGTTKKSSALWLRELQSLISPTCQNSPPGRGLKQLPRWWRIVIPAATPPVISSNVPISFYIRAWGIACALTRLDFLSTTSSAGEEWREHSGCWRILQRCVPFLRECSKAALLQIGAGVVANMSI